MKRAVVFVTVAAVSTLAFARPHGPGCGYRPPPGPRHHSHGGWWGRGGCNFWPGFFGGVVGGALVRPVVSPAPVVVATPVVVTTPVVAAPIVAAPVVTAPAVVTTPVVAAPVVTTPVVSAPVAQTQNVWVEGRYVDQVQPNGTVLHVWSPGHYEQRSVIVQ